MALDPAFVWGDGGAQMTPEAIAAQRKVADAMMAQGMDYRPIGSPWQGLARVAQGMMGGYDSYRADKAEKANRAADQDLRTKLLTGGGGVSPSASAASPAATVQAPVAGLETAPNGVQIVNGDLNLSPMDNLDLKEKIKGFEGFTPQAKWDYKQNSNGYGTRAAYPGEVIDRPTAEARLGEEVAKARGSVDQFSPGLPTGASDALTSLTMNAGPKWQSAGLGNAVQAGDLGAAKDRLLQYNRAGGEVLPGLTSRRQQEAALFDQGQPVQVASLGGAPTPDSKPSPQQVVTQAMTQPQGQPTPPVQVAQNAPASGGGGGLSGINPALIQAVTSPYASPGTKAIGMLLLQNKLGEKVTYQTTPDGDVLAMDPTGRNAPKVVYQATPKPISVPENGQLWDPRSRTFITPNQQGAPVTGPDGKPIAIPPGVDPKEFRKRITEATADASTGKKTEVQAKDEKFANKMELSEGVIGKVGDDQGTGFWNNVLESKIPFTDARAIPGANYMQSDKYQQYRQAKDNFITALLRDESGAAIGSSEFVRYEKEMFPQPGDGAGVIKQKAEARRIAIEAMKKGAGPGYKSPTAPADAPQGVDPKVWDAMTPQERALWK